MQNFLKYLNEQQFLEEASGVFRNRFTSVSETDIESILKRNKIIRLVKKRLFWAGINRKTKEVLFKFDPENLTFVSDLPLADFERGLIKNES